MSIPITVLNFARAESDRMFSAILSDTGALNTWHHYREIAPVDHQNVIRQNRDTLYSAAIVDISQGAELVVPDAGGRYLSVMVVSQDHFVEQIFHEPGTYHLDEAQIGTPYVLLGVRTLVDPEDADDLRAVHAIQDGLGISAGSATPFEVPDYDTATFDVTRDALITLQRGLPGLDRTFGTRAEVDPVRHLLGSAAAWGGLPEHEAYYANVEPGLQVGTYSLTVTDDVPVDAFWSVSLYNSAGYFEPATRGVNSISSVTAVRDPGGTITITVGPTDDGAANFLQVMPGWNYMVRYYRPRQEILDGTWRFPEFTPAGRSPSR